MYCLSFTFVNVPFVASLDTVMSSTVNPVTFSLNVNVYVIELAFVGFAFGLAVIVHVGSVVSAVILFPVLLALVTVHAFPTLSVILPPVNVFIANTPLSPAVIVYV